VSLSGFPKNIDAGMIEECFLNFRRRFGYGGASRDGGRTGNWRRQLQRTHLVHRTNQQADSSYHVPPVAAALAPGQLPSLLVVVSLWYSAGELSRINLTRVALEVVETLPTQVTSSLARLGQ
jgi:hypothetical protein